MIGRAGAALALAKTRSAVVALAGVVATLACASAPSAPPVRVSDGRYVMGTVLEATLYARDAASGRAALDDLFALAERLDALLSVYHPDSDVSRLNDRAGRGAQSVDPAVAAILHESVGLSRLTGGAFDVTVGPLVELWIAAAETGVAPSRESIDRARAVVGAEKLAFASEREVELSVPGMSVNLGGVAKGWALDRMRERLGEHGIESALLNFGQSSTWAIGSPPDAPGWRLLARSAAEGFLGVMSLSDVALSVSGTLGDFVEIEGRRYGHVLDPRTGQPLTRRRQAIVLARDAALAEALSKALLVMGERDGIALVEAQPGCEALLDDAEGGRWVTTGWQNASELTAPEASPANGR